MREVPLWNVATNKISGTSYSQVSGTAVICYVLVPAYIFLNIERGTTLFSDHLF
jgi:hypothetical protein